MQTVGVTGRYQKMKTMIFLVSALLGITAKGYGLTKWSAQYTGVTYVAITEGTHNIDSPYIGVLCVDNNGNRLDLDQVSWTVDPSTYEVDVTFASSFTGWVRLSGPWPTSDTANSTDFAVTIGQSNGSRLNVCAQCDTYVARRTYNGNSFVAFSGVSLTWISFNAATVYVYLRENIATFGLDQSTCEGSSYSIDGTANVECAVSSMPDDVVPLGVASISGGEFTGVTDMRPW
jgi:hypothetical protein